MVFPRYWKPRGGGLRDAWDSMTAWSPWPSTAAAGTVGLIALLAVVTVAWLLVVAVRAGRPAGPPGVWHPESPRRAAVQYPASLIATACADPTNRIDRAGEPDRQTLRVRLVKAARKHAKAGGISDLQRTDLPE